MSEWVTIECERALYVDFGINVIACDRLPSNPTLILKLSPEAIAKLRADTATCDRGFPKRCLHFVGFKDPRITKDERYDRARRVFGPPDFLHRGWDMRAQREIMDGDTVVFANGDASQAPRVHSFDDSAVL